MIDFLCMNSSSESRWSCELIGYSPLPWSGRTFFFIWFSAPVAIILRHERANKSLYFFLSQLNRCSRNIANPLLRSRAFQLICSLLTRVIVITKSVTLLTLVNCELLWVMEVSGLRLAFSLLLLFCFSSIFFFNINTIEPLWFDKIGIGLIWSKGREGKLNVWEVWVFFWLNFF